MLCRAISLATGVGNAMVGEVSIYRVEWFHFSDKAVFQHTLKNSGRGHHEDIWKKSIQAKGTASRNAPGWERF